MEFKRFSDMRKDYFSIAAGDKMIIDASMIDGCGLFGVSVPDDLIRTMIKGKINQSLGLYPMSYDFGACDFLLDGFKFFVDFECEKTHVYSGKTWKRLYTFYRLRAFRMVVYKAGDPWGLPVFSDFYGPFNKSYEKIKEAVI